MRPAALPAVQNSINVDPGQPTLPGLEGDIVARYSAYAGDEMNSKVLLRADRPIDAPLFGAFDEAVTAARTIMIADRQDARWGLFKRHPGRVESIALLQVKDGIRLARTTLALDTYKEPVPGQMFPGQNWSRGGPRLTVRESPATLALVGADMLVDLRSGQPSGMIELPRR
jgi:hypothetical protein